MICEKCKQPVELGVSSGGKTYHALCLIEFQAEQIKSLVAERDALQAKVEALTSINAELNRDLTTRTQERNAAHAAGRKEALEEAAQWHEHEASRWQAIIDADDTPISGERYGVRAAGHSMDADSIRALQPQQEEG